MRDFVARTGLGEQVVERLIAIGAFDWTDAPRRELLWQLRTTMEDANPARPALGLTDDAQRALGASLPPMTFAEKVAAEYRSWRWRRRPTPSSCSANGWRRAA